ncbi:MAG: motility protein A [Rhodospirillales bacterium]
MNARALVSGVGQRMTRLGLTVDPATFIGLGCGFGLLAAAIAFGGSPHSFVNLPSILIVLGGTFSAITISCSLAEVVNTVRVVGKAMVENYGNPSEAAIAVLRTAETARRQGVLALQNLLDGTTDQPFLQKGLSLVVDGAPTAEIEEVLSHDMQATMQRHAKGAGVLRKAAEYAPAMGLIGTLIGLVQMLGNLDDPSHIGPSMAVALLTTLYGAVLANLVFSPLAAKLERNSEHETLLNLIYLTAAISIARQENPRRLETLLNSILPPACRVKYFN